MRGKLREDGSEGVQHIFRFFIFHKAKKRGDLLGGVTITQYLCPQMVGARTPRGGVAYDPNNGP